MEQQTQFQFESGKQIIYVVSHHAFASNNFNILGVDFDCRLVMNDVIFGGHEWNEAACPIDLEGITLSHDR